MKVILIGFMGSGKTTVGGLLAGRLGLSSIEVDEEVVRTSGRRTVSEIFALEGEAGFRRREMEAAGRCAARTNVVIATGGGIILRRENIEALRTGGGIVVYLETSFGEIARRLNGDVTRPLWGDPDRAHLLYRERLPLYASYADVWVKTDGVTPNDVVEQIASRLEEGVVCA